MASLSPTNTQLPSSWPSETTNSNSFREASFSSYLSNSEENYIRTLVESTQFHLHPNENHQKNKVDDGEIDVFSADKYFNTRLEVRNNNSSKISPSAKYQALVFNEDKVDEENVKVHSSKPLKVQSRTSSITQSELSLSSQSALLKRFPRTPSRISSREGNGNTKNGRISLLSCSCCVKKSVDIEREVSNYPGVNKGVPRSIKTSLDAADITRLNKLRVLDNPDPFFFPSISDSPVTNKEEEARKSLDVFGSSDLDEGSKRFNLKKRLDMLAWDAIPRAEEICTSNAPSETYRDTESDASSDLFEIECLSCSANPVINVQGPRVNILPTDGSATPTSGYAPSEASIEWSVVTASAADFSIVSDSEDLRSSALPSVNRHKIGSKSISKAKLSNKEVQKSVSSNLLGCKSQKAVNVAGEFHRKSPVGGKSESQRIQRFSDSFAPVTRFQAEARLSGFGHRRRQSLSSDLLYIQ